MSDLENKLTVIKQYGKLQISRGPSGKTTSTLRVASPSKNLNITISAVSTLGIEDSIKYLHQKVKTELKCLEALLKVYKEE